MTRRLPMVMLAAFVLAGIGPFVACRPESSTDTSADQFTGKSCTIDAECVFYLACIEGTCHQRCRYGINTCTNGATCRPDNICYPSTASTGPTTGSPTTGPTTSSPKPTPSGSDAGSRVCAAPTDCYREVDGGALRGEVRCLTQIATGYCTHTCVADNECCAVAGECKASIKQVCSVFASNPNMCLLSCEDPDVASAAAVYGAVGDADAYCHTYAGASTTCRSTGGGASSRKVCIPG